MPESHESEEPAFRIQSVSIPDETALPSVVAIHPQLRPPLFLLTNDISSDIRSLRERFPWLSGSLQGTEPVYCLPAAMIEALRVVGPHQQFALTADQAEAEKALTESCGSAYIGIWGRRWINSGCFIDKPPISPDALREIGFTAGQVLNADQALNRTDGISLKLRGYVGWLVTEPTFMANRDELRQRWESLPEEIRPLFPLQRTIARPSAGPVEEGVDRRPDDCRLQLDEFLDRWGLTGLETWDLPCPQGPLLPAAMAATSPAMPHHGVHLVLPLHYPLTSDDELIRLIRTEQRRLASSNGLDSTLASLEHHEVYAQMISVQHLEHAVRSRYVGKQSGFVGAIENAMAIALGLTTDYVQKLRRGISACRRGKRNSMKWLWPQIR